MPKKKFSTIKDKELFILNKPQDKSHKTKSKKPLWKKVFSKIKTAL